MSCRYSFELPLRQIILDFCRLLHHPGDELSPKVTELLRLFDDRLDLILQVLTSKSLLVEHEYFRQGRGTSSSAERFSSANPEERVCFNVLLELLQY